MEKIETLQDLKKAAMEGKAVCRKDKSRRMPAAFIIMMTGETILRFFDEGMYIYDKTGENEHGNT